MADILEAEFKKVSGDGPVPKNPYADISDAEIVVSFITRLFEEGATTRDWKRLNKALKGMYGDPLGAYSLWMRPESKQPKAPENPWNPPPQR
jgi:hypothetical protein